MDRLEILGKMQGIDIFDMKPLDASRLGVYNLSGTLPQHTTRIRPLKYICKAGKNEIRKER